MHPFFDGVIGWGYICQALNESRPGSFDRQDCRNGPERYGILEPTLNVELNVTSYVRLAAGVGYPFVLAERDRQFSSAQLSGVAISAALEIGRF